MIDVGMNTIALSRVGGDVNITLCREVGQWTKAQRITASKAFIMGMLLSSEAQEEAVRFQVASGIILTIENIPYDRAWLTMNCCRGGRKLVACLEGDVIRNVGVSLQQMSSAGVSLSLALMKSRSFRVGHCYLEE